MCLSDSTTLNGYPGRWITYWVTSASSTFDRDTYSFSSILSIGLSSYFLTSFLDRIGFRANAIEGVLFLNGMVSFSTLECIFILRTLLLVTVLSFLSDLYLVVPIWFVFAALFVLFSSFCLVVTNSFLAGLGLHTAIWLFFIDRILRIAMLWKF